MLLKSWLKYIKFSNNQKPNISSFFINEAFALQNETKNAPKPAGNASNSSSASSEIPDESSFYFMLDEDNIYILSDQRNDIAKTQEVIPV